LPFPDGTIIARLAWSYVPSEENNKVFGRFQSFVAGSATNVQFKDVPNAEVHIVDGGHFGLDRAADEIAALVLGFVGSSRELVRDAAATMKPL
jgi:hypothetical protein